MSQTVNRRVNDRRAALLAFVDFKAPWLISNSAERFGKELLIYQADITEYRAH